MGLRHVGSWCGVLVWVGLVACTGDDHADAGGDAGGRDAQVADGGGDAAIDADVIDSGDAALDADVCTREVVAQAELLGRAAAAGCMRDQDCVLVGSCDEGFGFVAVPHAFVAETNALIAATECDWFDGPFYDAACETGRCVARDSGGACGSDEPPLCASGQLLYAKPCRPASSGAPVVESGCHKPCDPTASTDCADGSTCRAASVCSTRYSPSGDNDCRGCEPITVFLCTE